MTETAALVLFPVAQLAALFLAGWICWRTSPEKKD